MWTSPGVRTIILKLPTRARGPGMVSITHHVFMYRGEQRSPSHRKSLVGLRNVRQAKKARGWDDFTLTRKSEQEAWVTGRATQKRVVAASGLEAGAVLAEDNSACARGTQSTGAHLSQG